MLYLARCGYAAKGLVYLLVGVLVMREAFADPGLLVSRIAALQLLVRQPLGFGILSAVVIGLGSYILWRLVQAILDPEQCGTDITGLVQRLGHLDNGLFYGALAYAGVKVLTGAPIQDNRQAMQDWTARILTWPAGPYLVGAGGLVTMGIGLYTSYQGWTVSFRKHLKPRARAQRWVLIIGRIGLLARGLIIGVVGFFLLRAALQLDADYTVGLRGALDALTRGPLGPWVLGTLGIGMLAYSAHQLTEAYAYKIRVNVTTDMRFFRQTIN